MSAAENLSTSFALSATYSLMKPNATVDVYRNIYEAAKIQPWEEPMNVEEAVVPEFIRILRERDLATPDKRSLHPYWNPSVVYNPQEVFGTLIQVTDYHHSPLPCTTLPPESDVKGYIETVMRTEGRVPVWKQFEILLDITNNNVVGAANLGFVASRVMARGLDSRAYPHIKVSDVDLIEWSHKIGQFESEDEEIHDSSGDTYYFWSHAFASIFYHLHPGNQTLYQKAFEHGTDIMKFVRKHIAHTPITSDHYEASLLGRNIGLALTESDWYNQTEKTFGEKTTRSNFLTMGKTIFRYLFTDDEYADYQHPDIYEKTVNGGLWKRQNLARGIADVVETYASTGFNRTLDLGAGTGALTIELLKRGYHVDALDFFSEPLQRLREHALQENLSTHLSTCQGDMNDAFPFEDDQYDTITSLRANRYIRNLDTFTSEVHRVLKPGGIFILPVFAIDIIPWKRHSVKGLMQETSVHAISRVLQNVGFEIITDNLTYKHTVHTNEGNREVPFYYSPAFIVARKPMVAVTGENAAS